LEFSVKLTIPVSHVKVAVHTYATGLFKIENTVNLMFLFQFTITKIFTLVQALLYFISGLFEAGISDKVVETVSSFYTIFKLKCDRIWHWNPRRGHTECIKLYNKPVTIYL
jgi:hypothetical protein